MSTYEQVAARVQDVRNMLLQRQIRIRSGSVLDQLLRRAERLSEKWDSGAIAKLLLNVESAADDERALHVQSLANDYQLATDALHVNRLTSALLAIQDDQDVQQLLRRLAGGIVQPNDRNPSQAKDALWEVLLFAHLRDRGLIARFQDPPDIVMMLDGSEYPIACKKVWSEKGGKTIFAKEESNFDHLRMEE